MHNRSSERYSALPVSGECTPLSQNCALEAEGKGMVAGRMRPATSQVIVGDDLREGCLKAIYEMAPVFGWASATNHCQDYFAQSLLSVLRAISEGALCKP